MLRLIFPIFADRQFASRFTHQESRMDIVPIGISPELSVGCPLRGKLPFNLRIPVQNPKVLRPCGFPKSNELRPATNAFSRDDCRLVGSRTHLPPQSCSLAECFSFLIFPRVMFCITKTDPEGLLTAKSGLPS